MCDGERGAADIEEQTSLAVIAPSAPYLKVAVPLFVRPPPPPPFPFPPPKKKGVAIKGIYSAKKASVSKQVPNGLDVVSEEREPGRARHGQACSRHIVKKKQFS